MSEHATAEMELPTLSGLREDGLPEDGYGTRRDAPAEVLPGPDDDAPSGPPGLAGALIGWVQRHLGIIGALISLICVGGVVMWALGQEAPQLPNTPERITALVTAIVLYALATLVRGERWLRLLRRDGAHPSRADAHALVVVGYAINNVLPARAGDFARALLMAPRAGTRRRTVVGTLVAERLLDIVVIVLLFMVVGYGLLGEATNGSLEVVGAVFAVAVLGVLGLWAAVHRSPRAARIAVPLLASTARIRGRHGAILLAMTILIWGIEAGVWWSVGQAAGIDDFSPMEGLYIVALASVFAMIPSGPGYAGTQDAATIIGIKAIGGTNAIAISYLLLVRFVIVVPITIVGFGLIALRYGGVRRLMAMRRSSEDEQPAPAA